MGQPARKQSNSNTVLRAYIATCKAGNEHLDFTDGIMDLDLPGLTKELDALGTSSPGNDAKSLPSNSNATSRHGVVPGAFAYFQVAFSGSVPFASALASMMAFNHAANPSACES